MLFQSLSFILVFLPVILTGYFLLCARGKDYRVAQWWLICASLLFYGMFHVLFPVLLLCSALITYGLCAWMKRTQAEGQVKALRTAGVVLHLGVLFLYKYLDFFRGQLSLVTGETFTPLALLLPVGLSFTTFQQIAFLIDMKRAVLNEEQGLSASGCTLTEYLTYITFFPKLVQGPITLPSEFLPQLRDTARRTFSVERFTDALLLFITGLAKKVLLADVLSPVVRYGYEQTYYLDTLCVIAVLVSYAFQLYFDFSGYCDMAQGVAGMLNLDLPDNFRSPFQARSIKSLWQRWHMSLSRFFTRYVYIPLGGSRKGRARTLLNVMVVFVLSAVWHGAGWTYLAWGVLEGLFVVCEGWWTGD
ncbi:MAG: MBOAT family protein, partial [Lachnospiraceae bacterium]|nr:MBOAT family protein [Lachnospiraceae bacterium]